MYIEDIAQAYEELGLHFAVDEQEQRIRFKMNTRVSPDVAFIARIVNPTTATFPPILPMPCSSTAPTGGCCSAISR